MGNIVKMRVEGGAELVRKLRALGMEVEDALERIATAGGEVLAAAANTRAPEAVIEVETTEKSKDRATVAIGPPADRWYLRFFETGTQPHEITGAPLVFAGRAGLVFARQVQHSGMAARPYLRPAFDEQQDAAKNTAGEEVKAAMRRAGG